MPCTISSASSRAGGDRDRPENPGAALFQTLEHQHAGGEIDPVGAQRQRLGQPAAAIDQGHAQGAHRAIGAFGLAQKRRAFAGGEVFAQAIGAVQLHAGLRGGRPRGLTAGTVGRVAPAAGGAVSCAPILVAVAALGAEYFAKRVDGGAGIGMRIQPSMTFGADATHWRTNEAASANSGSWAGVSRAAVATDLPALPVDDRSKGRGVAVEMGSMSRGV